MSDRSVSKLIRHLTGFCIVLLVGCAPKYYAPNTQNVPLLTTKGDAAISVAGGEGRIEVQGA